MIAKLAGLDFSIAYLDIILIRSKNWKETAEHIGFLRELKILA